MAGESIRAKKEDGGLWWIFSIFPVYDLIKNKDLMCEDERQIQIDNLLNETMQLDKVIHAIVKRSIKYEIISE